MKVRFVSLFHLILSVCWPQSTQAVEISDVGLEDAIRDALDKPVGEITVEDMESLSEISLSTGLPLVQNLDGLEAAVNLTTLNLSGSY